MTPLAGMFPGDAMGSAELMRWAVQNPEMAAQLFAQTGSQPPEAGLGNEPPSPFAGMEFSSSERRDRVAAPPAGSLPNIPGAIAAIPTPGKLAAQYQPDMGGWGATPESMGVPPTPPAPDMADWGATQDAYPLVQNPAAPGEANPFPTPIGEAQGNPFPTPIGSPAPAGAGMSGLGDALKGISVPSAPDAQRVSTPAAPRPTPIGNSQMIEMLAKMMSGGQAQAQQQLRLGQSLPSPQIYR